MLRRCYSANQKGFQNYGGRGIAVCDEWRNSFDAFLSDMGERPDGASLDRIDTNGNYEPSNCRWATPKEQAHNRRSNIYITHNGVTMIANDWAKHLGMARTTFFRRLQDGWSTTEAIETPVSPPHRVRGRIKKSK